MVFYYTLYLFLKCLCRFQVNGLIFDHFKWKEVLVHLKPLRFLISLRTWLLHPTMKPRYCHTTIRIGQSHQGFIASISMEKVSFNLTQHLIFTMYFIQLRCCQPLSSIYPCMFLKMLLPIYDICIYLRRLSATGVNKWQRSVVIFIFLLTHLLFYCYHFKFNAL